MLLISVRQLHVLNYFSSAEVVKLPLLFFLNRRQNMHIYCFCKDNIEGNRKKILLDVNNGAMQNITWIKKCGFKSTPIFVLKSWRSIKLWGNDVSWSPIFGEGGTKINLQESFISQGGDTDWLSQSHSKGILLCNV